MGIAAAAAAHVAAATAPGLDWLAVIAEQVPPLQHDRGERWPLVLWEGVGFEPQPPAVTRMLLARGLVQHIRLDARMIETGRALRAAGAPVIAMEGRSGTWPYDLAPPGEPWRHSYPQHAQVPPAWRSLPAPTRFRGWAVAADQLRAVLLAFREAGVRLDGVWLDYEGEPSQANYWAARGSPASRRLIPEAALRSEASFGDYRRQLWNQLLSAYVAAPVREIFPEVAVTNWVVTLASPTAPVLDWSNRPHPALGPTLFTHSNPVAYAIDTAFLANRPAQPYLEQPAVDRLYTHVMLRQVSADAHNRSRLAPHLGAVVWIARWVPDNDTPTPVMSRARYREALRHLWLRGVDAMEVFNPLRSGYEEMAVMEVIDAVAVYDEMLAYRRMLEAGEPLNFAYPGVDAPGPFWSGLRLGDEVLIRVAHQGRPGTVVTLEIEPWPGQRISLRVPYEGRTFRLRQGRIAGQDDGRQSGHD